MFKNLKSLDLASFTIMGSSIQAIFGFIIGIIVLIASTVISKSFNYYTLIYPFLFAFTAFIIDIASYFISGGLFNLLSRKFSVNFDLDNGKVRDLSVLQIAIISAIATAVILILVYPIFALIFGSLSSLGAFLMYMPVLYALYYVSMIFANPLYLVGIVAMTFVLTAIFVFLYNQISLKVRAIELDLSEIHGNRTQINSINPLSIALPISIVSLIIGLIIAIVNSLYMTNVLTALFSILSAVVTTFISTFIIAYLAALLYNFMVNKGILGPITIKLEDVSDE
ncbi:MAG: hypothetical protein LBM96_11000 [Methanobrevibacter sp.]|jgi:hypothetical protein|nr:hypothetical protein [Candidatus Methanoflexus mossambicus]